MNITPQGSRNTTHMLAELQSVEYIGRHHDYYSSFLNAHHQLPIFTKAHSFPPPPFHAKYTWPARLPTPMMSRFRKVDKGAFPVKKEVERHLSLPIPAPNSYLVQYLALCHYCYNIILTLTAIALYLYDIMIDPVYIQGAFSIPFLLKQTMCTHYSQVAYNIMSQHNEVAYNISYVTAE